MDTKRVSWHPMKVFLAPEDQFQISSVGPDDDIFIVDYSGSVDFTLCLAAKAKSVIVLDHHLTAVSAFTAAGSGDGLPKNLHVELDLQRSGATIALDYFSRRLSEEASACRGDPTVEAIADSVGAAGAEEAVPVGEGDEEGAASPEASEAAVGSAQEEATTRASKRRKKKAAAKAGRGGDKSAAAAPKPKAEIAPADVCIPCGTNGDPAAAAKGIKPYFATASPPSAAGGYGALLGEDVRGVALLRFLRLVEDGDLYRFWLKDSKEFSAGFGSLRLNFDLRINPGLFAELRGLDVHSVIEAGRKGVEGENRKINEEMGRTFIVNVPEVGVRCLGVRTSYPELRSAVGHALAERSAREGLSPLGIVAYGTPELERKGYIKVSVRAIEGGDTLKLTEKFGGGGHQAASSCNVLKFKFDNWCED